MLSFSSIPYFILIALTLLICFRIFIIPHWDRNRIVNDTKTKGWEIIDIVWKPFGPGWLGEKSDRIYLVKFKDENSLTRTKYCKTSMLTGVYWK